MFGKIETDRTEAPYSETLNKPQQMIVILRDVSGSMFKAIDYENVAMGFFFNEGKKSKYANRNHICLIDFCDKPEVVLDWTLMKEANPELTNEVGGNTDINKAVMLAIEKCESKIRDFSKFGTPYGPPLVVLLTDGAPTSDISESVKAVQKKRSEKDKNGNSKFIFLPIYVGDGGVPEDLLRYTGSALIARSSDTDGKYREIFDFLFNTIKAIHNTVEAGGGQIKVDPMGMDAIILN